MQRILLCSAALWLLALSASASAADGSGPMLPQVYQAQVDVSGWLMSEKLDGVRGYWNGSELRSKNGNLLFAPAEFTNGLPQFALEGELWCGRGQFAQTVSIVRQKQPHAGWRQVKFAIFDVPEASGGFRQRIELARRWFAEHPSRYAYVIPQHPVQSTEHLQQELARIERIGGEGLIVRQPDAHYAAGRRPQILKVKNYQDAEARVVAQLPGKGRNAGRMGALLVTQADGVQFKLGSGFSNAEREAPPAIGSIITFKYYGRHRSGLPRFPVFLRRRLDQGL